TLIQKGSNPTITIKSNNVIIENLNVRHIDTGSKSPAILINGDYNSLNNIQIDTNSYGIQLDQANKNTISHVNILGNEDESIKNRNSAIDLWDLHHNEISDTQIRYVQDGIYIEKSNENKIHRNSVSHSRY